MDKPTVGLAKQAYQGAPKPLRDNILGKEDLELRRDMPKWNYKTKRQRRAELLDTL